MLKSVAKEHLKQSQNSSGNIPSFLSSLVRSFKRILLPMWGGLRENFAGQQNSEKKIIVRVRPASRHKCPRCWTFTREEEKDLCQRCEEVIGCDELLPVHGAVDGNQYLGEM